MLRREVDQALSGYDALLLPTAAIPAPVLGANAVEIDGATEPVRNVISQLVSPGGEATAFPPDTLIVHDVGANMHRLDQIVRMMCED